MHQRERGQLGARDHELVTVRDQHVAQQLLDLRVCLVVTLVVGQTELLALLERAVQIGVDLVASTDAWITRVSVVRTSRPGGAGIRAPSKPSYRVNGVPAVR
jgi:hypothetical protein